MTADTGKIIQITNISPTVSNEQLKSLFSIIGDVDQVKLYPENSSVEVATRVGYVKYKDGDSVGVSMHLTNSVLVDKALIIVPVLDSEIPDETKALGIFNESDNSYNNLPQYPVLPANTELSKVEEIRRTIYASNVDATLTTEALMEFFSQAGEIKYMRMAGDEKASFRGAFVEYSDQNSVLRALNLNGQSLGGALVKITPSKTSVIKPPVLPGIAASSKEIEEALKKVNEYESLISAVVDPSTNGNSNSRSRKTSRSRRSRSRSRRSRSRSRRSRSRRSRSRRSRRHSRSRSRDRRRSKDKRRRRSRSSSDEKRRKSRSGSKHRSSEKSKHSSKSSKEKKRKRSRSSSHKKKHKSKHSDEE